jgi:hypothetical protein
VTISEKPPVTIDSNLSNRIRGKRAGLGTITAAIQGFLVQRIGLYRILLLGTSAARPAQCWPTETTLENVANDGETRDEAMPDPFVPAWSCDIGVAH